MGWKDQGNKSDKEEEAPEQKKKDTDEAEKAAAAGEAKATMFATEKAHGNIASLEASLLSIDLRYDAVKRFELEPLGNGKTRVYMIASKKDLGVVDLTDPKIKAQVDDYLKDFKKLELEISQPIEFGGDLMKRDGVDLFVLGKTKGNKIVGSGRSHAGTMNIPETEGINILRQRIPDHIIKKYPDSFYDQTRAYWEEINGPWLDKAIDSGSDIRFIQDPRLIENSLHIVTEDQKRLIKIFKNISEHKTYLYFEYNYLLNKGYKLLENGLMIKI